MLSGLVRLLEGEQSPLASLKFPLGPSLSSAASLSRMSSALNFSLTISLSLGTKSDRRFHLGLFAFFHSVRLEMYGIWLSGESELVGVSSRGVKSLIASGVRGPSSVA